MHHSWMTLEEKCLFTNKNGIKERIESDGSK
jgi:hypothetical protein